MYDLPTINLDLQPFKGVPRELLFRSSILECVRDEDIGKELQDRALHGKLVKIGIQERDDSFGERRGSIELHIEIRIKPPSSAVC